MVVFNGPTEYLAIADDSSASRHSRVDFFKKRRSNFYAKNGVLPFPPELLRSLGTADYLSIIIAMPQSVNAFFQAFYRNIFFSHKVSLMEGFDRSPRKTSRPVGLNDQPPPVRAIRRIIKGGVRRDGCHIPFSTVVLNHPG